MPICTACIKKKLPASSAPEADPSACFSDYELKRNLNRDLALLGQERDDPKAKERIAQKHALRVVNAKIPIPDMRVEYENPRP